MRQESVYVYLETDKLLFVDVLLFEFFWLHALTCNFTLMQSLSKHSFDCKSFLTLGAFSASNKNNNQESLLTKIKADSVNHFPLVVLWFGQVTHRNFEAVRFFVCN